MTTLKNLSPKTTSLLISGLLLLSAFGALLAGCGKKEDTPPASSGYYNGPTKSKSAATGQGAAKTGAD